MFIEDYIQEVKNRDAEYCVPEMNIKEMANLIFEVMPLLMNEEKRIPERESQGTEKSLISRAVWFLRDSFSGPYPGFRGESPEEYLLRREKEHIKYVLEAYYSE